MHASTNKQLECFIIAIHCCLSTRWMTTDPTKTAAAAANKGSSDVEDRLIHCCKNPCIDLQARTARSNQVFSWQSQFQLGGFVCRRVLSSPVSPRTQQCPSVEERLNPTFCSASRTTTKLNPWTKSMYLDTNFGDPGNPYDLVFATWRGELYVADSKIVSDGASSFPRCCCL